MPLVIYEDEEFLVISKPAGADSHVCPRGPGVYEWLREKDPAWSTLSLPHRLDRLTSGILIMGKNTRGKKWLVKVFAERLVKKSYLFLTQGEPVQLPAACDAPVGRRGSRPIAHPDGLPARTEFHAVAAGTNVSLVEARPLTGRTHQVRSHAAELLMPVLGDREHGPETAFAWPMFYLHAARLELTHPRTGGALALECPPPAYFGAIAAGLTDVDSLQKMARRAGDLAMPGFPLRLPES
jgi:23S rRNA-/tRNA-specific pseudouridylate synthase